MKYPIGTIFALICLSNALPRPPCPGSASIHTPNLSNATGTVSPVSLPPISTSSSFSTSTSNSTSTAISTSTPTNTVGARSSDSSSDASSGQTSVQYGRRAVEARKLDMDEITDELVDNPGGAIGQHVGHAITGLFDDDKKDEPENADGEPDSNQTPKVVHENVPSAGGVKADRTININLNGGSGGAGTIININLGGEPGVPTSGKSNGQTEPKPTDESSSDAGDIGGDVGSSIGSTVGSILGGPLGGNVGKFVGGAAGSLAGTIGDGIADIFDGDDHKSDDHDGDRVEGQDGDADSDSGPSCGTSTQ